MLKIRQEIWDDVLFTLDCTFVSVAPVRTARTLLKFPARVALSVICSKTVNHHFRTPFKKSGCVGQVVEILPTAANNWRTMPKASCTRINKWMKSTPGSTTAQQNRSIDHNWKSIKRSLEGHSRLGALDSYFAVRIKRRAAVYGAHTPLVAVAKFKKKKEKKMSQKLCPSWLIVCRSIPLIRRLFTTKTTVIGLTSLLPTHENQLLPIRWYFFKIRVAAMSLT